MTLDPDDIEAVARRVAELLRASTSPTEPLVDAAELARVLGVDRGWVYARANRLGAVRLGDGPSARLRFELRRVRELLATGAAGQPRPAEPSPGRPVRARARTLPPGVKPVRARPSR
jgi:hypothetical protein